MRAVIQRVTRASVTIDGKIKGSIEIIARDKKLSIISVTEMPPISKIGALTPILCIIPTKPCT